MRREITTFNVNGAVCTAAVLAEIAVILETHGSVKVVNVAKPIENGPGVAAFHLGLFLQEALKAKREGKF